MSNPRRKPASPAAALVGKTGWARLGRRAARDNAGDPEILVPVTITAFAVKYGKERLEVRPIGGYGYQWVAVASVLLELPPDEDAYYRQIAGEASDEQ